MIKELICTNCPIGCPLRVEYEDGKILSISGNTCKNGITFGTNEVLCPKRTITSIVRLSNREGMLPVKSASELPKDRIFEFMEIISSAVATAPVKSGDVIVENIGGTGIDVVATKTVK